MEDDRLGLAGRQEIRRGKEIRRARQKLDGAAGPLRLPLDMSGGARLDQHPVMPVVELRERAVVKGQAHDVAGADGKVSLRVAGEILQRILFECHRDLRSKHALLQHSHDIAVARGRRAWLGKKASGRRSHPRALGKMVQLVGGIDSGDREQTRDDSGLGSAEASHGLGWCKIAAKRHDAGYAAVPRTPRDSPISRMVSRLNAGRSSGLRLVTRFWSTTTSLSTQLPSALRMSSRMVG